MRTEIVKQEILLMTTTTLAGREWAEKEERTAKELSPVEQLEEACWNGLLDEMLPGVIERSAEGKQLLLWQIVEWSSFLEIDLGASPAYTDNTVSVNPYLFLPYMVAN